MVLPGTLRYFYEFYDTSKYFGILLGTSRYLQVFLCISRALQTCFTFTLLPCIFQTSLEKNFICVLLLLLNHFGNGIGLVAYLEMVGNGIGLVACLNRFPHQA